MKITICGSAAFYTEMEKVKKGATENDGWVWERKGEEMKKYFDKIAWSDGILVLNYTKDNRGLI